VPAASPPLLNLYTAGFDRLVIAIGVKPDPIEMSRLVNLGKRSPDKFHVYATRAYRLGGKSQGVLVTAHLPERARDRHVLVEIEYRRNQSPARAVVELPRLWPLLLASKTDDIAVLRGTANFGSDRASEMPIRFPVEMPQLPDTERVIGIDLVHDEGPDQSYRLFVGYNPDKSFSLVVTFAERVSGLTDGIEFVAREATDLLNRVLGGATVHA